MSTILLESLLWLKRTENCFLSLMIYISDILDNTGCQNWLKRVFWIIPVVFVLVQMCGGSEKCVLRIVPGPICQLFRDIRNHKYILYLVVTGSLDYLSYWHLHHHTTRTARYSFNQWSYEYLRHFRESVWWSMNVVFSATNKHVAQNKLKSLKVTKWVRNDEWWRMKDEGWWFQAVGGFAFWQTDNICDCRVAFATENKIHANSYELHLSSKPKFINWLSLSINFLHQSTDQHSTPNNLIHPYLNLLQLLRPSYLMLWRLFFCYLFLWVLMIHDMTPSEPLQATTTHMSSMWADICWENFILLIEISEKLII